MAKRITTKDIANLAGVSRTTVSFVLNNVAGMRIPEETRQRVLDAARQLDYHPDSIARSMASGQRKIIGFVVRQSTEQAFVDQFLPHVLIGLAQAASEHGYHTIFEPIAPDRKVGTYDQLIRTRHVDGIILSGPRKDDEELPKIHAQGAHIVLLGQLPNSSVPYVDVDNVGGAMLATQHLLALGHRRIGLITNGSPVYTASADRLAGYRQALEAANVPFDESIVRFGNMTPQSGDEAMAALLSLPERPSAVFVASDTVALGALQTIKRHKLSIPQDIALVGFDDIPLSGFVEPPLTTIRLPAFELGWDAADMLIRIIRGDTSIPTLNVILETELIVRESCGAYLLNRHD